MRRTITTLLIASVIAVQAADAITATRAAAATPTRKVVTRKFTGTAVDADRWGPVQVSITVRKTTTVDAKGKKKVTRTMTQLTVPVYPDHSSRSARINEEALPILTQEALSAQSASIDAVSGATDTSYAFAESLNAAILKALKA